MITLLHGLRQTPNKLVTSYCQKQGKTSKSQVQSPECRCLSTETPKPKPRQLLQTEVAADPAVRTAQLHVTWGCGMELGFPRIEAQGSQAENMMLLTRSEYPISRHPSYCIFHASQLTPGLRFTHLQPTKLCDGVITTLLRPHARHEWNKQCSHSNL